MNLIPTQRSGLGNPTDPSVIAEANSSLATLFPVSYTHIIRYNVSFFNCKVSQLVAFQGLARMEKKTKIRQLSSIVKVVHQNVSCGNGDTWK